MQLSKLLLAALPALFFAVPAAASTPPAQGDVIRRVAPPPSNPHDVFRRVILVRKPEAGAIPSKKDCVCPKKRPGAEAPAKPVAPNPGN